MATEDQMKRIVENALGYPPNTLDGVLGAGAHLVNRIENAGNEAGGIINIPLFYGKEEEDVSDWIRQFEVAFTAIGKAAGTNGERQAAYAAAHLRGAAAQWYNEMKETNAARREEEARNELFRKVGNIPDRVYPEIGKERIEERNVGMNVRYNKPLNENYEDELVEKLEKMRIAKLEKQVRNMERELNNNGNKDQLNQRRNNRAPINYDKITCFRCHRKGHFATRCPLENNIRRNERRVNLMDEGNYGRDDEHEEYEESDDDYDYEYGEYDNPQLYNYERDLYEKDNPVRRRSNRINPTQGWKNFGKPNLDKDIVERGKEEYKYRNRKEIPMEEYMGDEQPMYDGPIGLDNTNISKRYKWSKKRGEYYDTMEGINRWKEAGGKRGPRKDNIVGVRPKDPVDYGNLLNIVEQQGKMIKRMLKKGVKQSDYARRILELENDEEIIDIPVWYIKQVEELEESDYESESEESDYEQEEGKKLYTIKEVMGENEEVVRENEFQKDNESSSEESSSDDSEISSENED
ncbi:ribonuclease H-like domain-containing protein [Rhizophagus irregularis DAOM 181602=DAOM 197198]|nr:ribonuclease H-like domain-containing protein [Rhizophagus irregularis DAOM 181602=DAOM 197198]